MWLKPLRAWQLHSKPDFLVCEHSQRGRQSYKDSYNLDLEVILFFTSYCSGGDTRITGDQHQLLGELPLEASCHATAADVSRKVCETNR